jgi:multidrug efflux system outer membrane protein
MLLNKTRHFFALSVPTLLAILTILSGCMVGPDYSRPDTYSEDAGAFVNQPSQWPDANELAPVGHWWDSFNDPVIDELVTLALANNNDLKIAAARVLEGRALVRRATGVRLPDVDYNASRALGRALPGMGTTKLYRQDLSISWIVDFFGKLRRSERAAIKDLLADKANQQALVHAVIAQTVSTRVDIATQQRLLEIAHSNIESRQQTLNIVDRRYNAGLVSSLELHLARENLAAAASTEPLARQNLALGLHSLDILLGRRPALVEAPENTLPYMPNLEPVPMSLPMSLLDRRPDVYSAEMELAAATERVGVSIAELFPDLTLSVGGGYLSDSYRLVTATENQIYSTIFALAAPIYKGGSLKAGVEAAKARAEAAVANYANVVLRAIGEVEDSLVKEKQTSIRVKLLQERFDEVLIADTQARQRYSQGIESVSLLVVLETERRRIIAENELALAIQSLYNTRIDLFLALGGDWEVGKERHKK